MFTTILSALIVIPLVAAALALFVGERGAKWICTIASLAVLGISLALPAGWNDAPNLTSRASALVKESMERAGVPSRLHEFVREAVERPGGPTQDDMAKVRAEGIEEPFKAVRADTGDMMLAVHGKNGKGSLLANGMKFSEFSPWIPSFRINYFVAVDGLSMPLVLLTTLLTFICLVYSWSFDHDKPPTERRPLKGFYILFMLLETGLIGVFCAMDMFLFYVFWELVLLPSYFLIGIWGGENRNYAAIKFFIYTLVGSVAMLVAMLVLYFKVDPHTFNMLTLIEHARGGDFSLRFQFWIFVALFLGFAVKVPVWPFHTWLPDAHVQAPTAFSVILAGVMLKMGGYGLFRLSLPIAPDAATSSVIVWGLGILGMINIVYGAFCAMGQSDFKSLVAYSSVSHMGYCLLGLAAFTFAGLDGSALQMINHGISSAGMFLVVGVIYDRAHHRDLDRFGGIALQMPRYFGLSLVIFFASLGLPGLNGFISEAFVFLGAWQSSVLPKWITLASTLGILLGAAYILWTIKRVFLGNLTVEKYKHFPDAVGREVLALAPLAALSIAIGVWPRLVLDFLDPSIQAILNTTVRSMAGS